MKDHNDSKPGKFIIHLQSEIREIVPIFLEHRARDLESIRAALKQDDLETIKVLGHKMHGTGSGYGFDAISEYGEQLEKAARNLQRPAIQELSEKLAYYLDNIEIIWVEEEN